MIAKAEGANIMMTAMLIEMPVNSDFAVAKTNYVAESAQPSLKACHALSRAFAYGLKRVNSRNPMTLLLYVNQSLG